MIYRIRTGYDYRLYVKKGMDMRDMILLMHKSKLTDKYQHNKSTYMKDMVSLISVNGHSTMCNPEVTD